MNLLDLPRTEKAAVAFLQERGILQTERKCRLHHSMKLYFADRIFWLCTRRSCKTKINMRVGNWFEGSRLSFVTAIRFIHGWAHEQTSLNWCDRVLNMEKGTAAAWNSYMREVAERVVENSSLQFHSLKNIKTEPEKSMVSNPSIDSSINEDEIELIENSLVKNIKIETEKTILENPSTLNIIERNASASLQNSQERKIGGKERIVEVDESQFSNYKTRAGRVFTPQWIIGGLCRETKECFLVRVLERNALTLLNTIENNVGEGSTVCTDNWCGYNINELEDAGLQELKHKYNFVDSTSDVLTKNVQRIWDLAKWRNKKHRGLARKNVDSYLAEFMWRTQLDTKDPFDAILDAIHQFWPPEIYVQQWHR